MNSPAKNDLPVLMLSIGALFMAVLISAVTIKSHERDKAQIIASDPYHAATVAAQAGIEIATRHIEWHGRTIRGGIGPHFCINGALFTANWDNVNMTDSTVLIRCRGFSTPRDNQEFRVDVDSLVKLEYLPPQLNNILSGYYSQDRPIEIVSSHAGRR
jgi:hypothetical protein